MKKIGLQYDCSNPKKKGCIARMITRKRSDMFKVVNKRSKNSHQKKISTNRISTEGNKEETKKISETKANLSRLWERDGINQMGQYMTTKRRPHNHKTRTINVK